MARSTTRFLNPSNVEFFTRENHGYQLHKHHFGVYRHHQIGRGICSPQLNCYFFCNQVVMQSHVLSCDAICEIAESIHGVLIASLAARLCFHKSLFARRSRICFSTFVSFLILEFEKSIQFESVFMVETVIGIQGLSLDSTHTEPCAHRLSFLGNRLSLSSLPQHFSTTR